MKNFIFWGILMSVLVLAGCGRTQEAGDAGDAGVVEDVGEVGDVDVSDEATADWQTYTRSDLKFSIKYPDGWVVDKREWQDSVINSNVRGFSFGTRESFIGGFIWHVIVYENTIDPNKRIEEVIAETGHQFEDRKEERRNIKVGSRDALMVVVSSDQRDWVTKNIIIKSDNYIYEISSGDSLRGGATEAGANSYEEFYKSFKIIE